VALLLLLLMQEKGRVMVAGELLSMALQIASVSPMQRAAEELYD
jgi:hypothetical protein